MKISPNYSKSDWVNLDLVLKNAPDWERAIDIFVDRIEGRILKQIKALETHSDCDIREFSGFAIMALDCLLIETLEQFYKGNLRTGPGMSVKAFHNFFSRCSAFRDFFNEEAKTEIFYKQIRCGILHQAQTKEKSSIHIKPHAPMLEWINLKKIDEGLSIHRVFFHEEIEKYFNDYVNNLRENHNLNLRRKFQKKMDSIVINL